MISKSFLKKCMINSLPLKMNFSKHTCKYVHIFNSKRLKKNNNPVIRPDDIEAYYYRINNTLDFDKQGIYLLAEDQHFTKTFLQRARDLSLGKLSFVSVIFTCLTSSVFVNYNIPILSIFIVPLMMIAFNKYGFVIYKQISPKKIDKIYLMQDMKTVILEMNAYNLWKTIDIKYLSKLEDQEYINYDKEYKNHYIRGHFFPVKVGNEICLIPNNIQIYNKEVFSAVFNGYYIVNSNELNETLEELETKDFENYTHKATTNKKFENIKSLFSKIKFWKTNK